MSLKIVVLAKQVPDTRNVGPDAMTPQGTINRAALPAVFNPEDLNALEQALRLKDQFPGSTISVLTMGLPKSAEVVREALYRGADCGYVTLSSVAARLSTAIPHRSVRRLQKSSDLLRSLTPKKS